MIKVNADYSKQGEFKELLQIIGECAALTLKLKGETITMVMGGSGAEPPSKTLRDTMAEMINSDLTITLELVTSMPFGSYAKIQKLNAGFALDVAKSVRAAGVVMAIHEMWENYTAQRHSGAWESRFGAAHASALGIEGKVMSELTGLPLDRVASVKATSKGPSVNVLDYRQKYVVISSADAGSGATRMAYSAIMCDRQHVQSIDLADGSLKDNENAIKKAMETFEKNPQATAGITGGLANQIRNEITVRFKGDVYIDPEKPELGLEKIEAKGEGADLGDLRSFVDTSPVTSDAPHGQIVISTPV